MAKRNTRQKAIRQLEQCKNGLDNNMSYFDTLANIYQEYHPDIALEFRMLVGIHIELKELIDKVIEKI